MRRGVGPRGNSGRAGRVEVLYEDEDVIAVDKPEGLATVAPEGGGKSLYDAVTRILQAKNPRARAAVVHRLDKGTSGCILFAKSARMKQSLMSGWNEAVRERMYLAVVEGRPRGDSGVLDSYLLEEKDGRVRECDPHRRGALRAITDWTLVATNGDYSALECRLETGRRHQIRAQLSAIGCPVAGDQRYGARTDPLGRLCLHAELLVIALAPGEEPVRIEAKAPREFLELARGRSGK